MNRHVNAIAGRLSLRPPQREALEILDRITEITPPGKEVDLKGALDIIRSEYPTVTDFERDFPSLCFALATGVGKTRLMGAFIAYLHLAHGIRNFFVLAPGLTIYNKLITDFTPNTPKYVFKGISEFAINPPDLITGENYEQRGTELFDELGRVRVNIFNIGKINSEVRGGKAPRIKRLTEYIGDSYFNYLSGLTDLVLLMDESHRYRASAGIRAINELKPVLGLELTATPMVEGSKGPVPFKNVILDYPLARAMEDGFVKEPAVATQRDLDPKKFGAEQLERIKLKDGIRLHEDTKVQLETYARQTEQRIVKPFMLIIARDTTHAGQLLKLIQSDEFFEGRYTDRVIQVDSSRTGEEEQQMIERLLKVESPDEPTEIVIHVNMLKEGWDVTNLYTIVPLRAANARVLIEQSIGRGLRLPYGKRTGVEAVDRLSIVAHDKFQEIVDEANKPGSVIRMKQLILEPPGSAERMTAVVAQTNVDRIIAPEQPANGIEQPAPTIASPFKNEVERKVAEVTLKLLRKRTGLATSTALLSKEEQKTIVTEVTASIAPKQLVLDGMEFTPNIAELVMTTTQLMVDQTIDIPRIVVVPRGEVTTGFNAFALDLASINYQPVSRELLLQTLRTHKQTILGAAG
ncbi:MAG: DEAD/DEAH box helicase family protein, partial [Flavobacteriales bacterium]|nr:DEAD/DEAH box helicase family protein [Flavobacteriales bacterium]